MPRAQLYAVMACVLSLSLSLAACKSTPPPEAAPTAATISSKTSPVIQDAAADATFNEAFTKMAGKDLIKVRVRAQGIELNDKMVVTFDADYHVVDADRIGGSQGMMIKPLGEALGQASASLDTSHPYLVVLMLDADAPFSILSELLYTVGQRELQPHRVVVRRADGSLSIFKAMTPKMGAQTSDVTLSVVSEGVTVSVDDKALPPVEGCDAAGPTVCMKQDAYDLRRVYALLQAAKSGKPEQQLINVKIAKKLPLEVLAQLAQTALFVREGELADDASYVKAAPALSYNDGCRDSAQDAGDSPVCLFPFMILGRAD